LGPTTSGLAFSVELGTACSVRTGAAESTLFLFSDGSTFSSPAGVASGCCGWPDCSGFTCEPFESLGLDSGAATDVAELEFSVGFVAAGTELLSGFISAAAEDVADWAGGVPAVGDETLAGFFSLPVMAMAALTYHG
jgi:hypothetical protein